MPIYGDTVTFTAIVSPNSGTTAPTGTVSFSIDGGASVDGTAVTCPTGSPADNLCAQYSDSTLSVGNHTAQASFTPTSGSIFAGSSSSAVDFSVVSPQTATESTISYVNMLYMQGVLNSGQDNSLVKELNQAIKMMNAGKISGAIQNLQYFISEVQDLYSSGVLNATEANTMITDANNVITALEQGG